MSDVHIISMSGKYPSYEAITERPQPLGWVERIFQWIARREAPVREERWLSQIGIQWFRHPDGAEAPDWLQRILSRRQSLDETFRDAKAGRAGKG